MKQPLREIKLEGIEIVENFFTLPRVREQSVIEFNHAVDVKYDIEDQKIGTVVEVQTSSKQIEGISARLKVNMIFNISFFEGIREGSIPEDVTITLNRVIIGTIRGLMFSLYRGTFLHNAILPIIPDVECQTMNLPPPRPLGKRVPKNHK